MNMYKLNHIYKNGNGIPHRIEAIHTDHMVVTALYSHGPSHREKYTLAGYYWSTYPEPLSDKCPYLRLIPDTFLPNERYLDEAGNILEVLHIDDTLMLCMDWATLQPYIYTTEGGYQRTPITMPLPSDPPSLFLKQLIAPKIKHPDYPERPNLTLQQPVHS